MNKLPINEKAVMKDIIQKIQICGDSIIRRQLQEEQIERLRKLRRNTVTINIHIASYVGVAAYVGLVIITRE